MPQKNLQPSDKTIDEKSKLYRFCTFLQPGQLYCSFLKLNRQFPVNHQMIIRVIAKKNRNKLFQP